MENLEEGAKSTQLATSGGSTGKQRSSVTQRAPGGSRSRSQSKQVIGSTASEGRARSPGGNNAASFQSAGGGSEVPETRLRVVKSHAQKQVKSSTNTDRWGSNNVNDDTSSTSSIPKEHAPPKPGLSKMLVRFPPNIKLPPPIEPKKPKDKLKIPPAEYKPDVVLCGCMFGGTYSKRHDDWAEPIGVRRTKSVPESLFLHEEFPRYRVKMCPHLSVSVPILPSMETASYEDLTDNTNLNNPKPVRGRHNSTPNSSDIIIKLPHGHPGQKPARQIQILDRENINVNSQASSSDNGSPQEEESTGRGGDGPGGEDGGEEEGEGEEEEMEIIEEEEVHETEHEEMEWMEEQEEEYYEDEEENYEVDLLRSLSLPGDVMLRDEPPEPPILMTPGISKSIPDVQFLTDTRPKRKRGFHFWEIVKLGCKVNTKIFLPFLNPCNKFPKEDVFHEAWHYLDEETERQERLRSLEQRKQAVERLAKDQFAIDMQKQLRRASKYVDGFNISREERRKAELIMLMAIIAHVRSFRGKFMSAG